MTGTLDNVNFQILLKQHGGNMERALAAWKKILGLGGYGDVPYEYAGGLDVQGLRVLLDEKKQGQPQAEAFNVKAVAHGQNVGLSGVPLSNAASDLEDRIKQIEDIASGDNPKEN